MKRASEASTVRSTRNPRSGYVLSAAVRRQTIMDVKCKQSAANIYQQFCDALPSGLQKTERLDIMNLFAKHGMDLLKVGANHGWEICHNTYQFEPATAIPPFSFDMNNIPAAQVPQGSTMRAGSETPPQEETLRDMEYLNELFARDQELIMKQHACTQQNTHEYDSKPPAEKKRKIN